MWLHGSQSSITGGSSARNGQIRRNIRWLQHNIRCVFTTPFGTPVDPDVNKIFATVSGPTPANRSTTADVGTVAAHSRSSSRPAMVSPEPAAATSMALPYASESSANTTAGRTRADMALSLANAGSSNE